MKKNLAFLFISFSFTFLVLLTLQKAREQKRYDILSEQANVIGKNIAHDFSEYFRVISGTGYQLNSLRQLNKLTKDELNSFYDRYMKGHPSVLGVNGVNEAGIIDEVYPFESNQEALGKKIQNYKDLYDPQVTQNLWVSNPLLLYQGMQGFVIYTRTDPSQKNCGMSP